MAGPDAAAPGVRQIAIHDGVAYAAAFDAGEIRAFDLSGGGLALAGTAAGLGHPDALAVSPDGARLYVTDFCGHDVRVVRLPDLAPLGSAFAAAPETDCAIPDFEPGDDRPPRRLPRPTALAVSADGRRLLVAGASVRPPEILLMDVDQATGGLAVAGYVTLDSDVPTSSTLDFVLAQEGHVLPADLAELRGFTAAVAAGDAVLVGGIVTGEVDVVAGDAIVERVQEGQGGVQGLLGAHGLALSPDDRHVYVGPRDQGFVGVFGLDGATGALLPIEAVPIAGTDGGPGAIIAVTVTADGGRVFAADGFAGVIHELSRDAATGRLQYQRLVSLPGCEGRPSFPVDLVTSGDGVSLYAADFQRQGRSCVLHLPLAGGPVVAFPDDGIGGTEDVILTRDDRHVYVPGYFDSAVVHYARDLATGALARQSAVEHADLHGVEYLALASDETRMVAASPVDDRLVVLDRNPATGGLTVRQSLTLDTTRGAAGLVASPDGSHVYLAAHHADAVSTFALGSDSALTLTHTLQGLPGLDWVNTLRMTRDGRYVLAAAVADSALSVLRVTPPGDDGCGGACP